MKLLPPLFPLCAVDQRTAPLSLDDDESPAFNGSRSDGDAFVTKTATYAVAHSTATYRPPRTTCEHTHDDSEVYHITRKDSQLQKRLLGVTLDGCVVDIYTFDDGSFHQKWSIQEVASVDSANTLLISVSGGVLGLRKYLSESPNMKW